MKPQVDALEIATLVAKVADEKQGRDIRVINVGPILAITDLFVVVSASNKRQVKTICDATTNTVRQELGRSPFSTEGVAQQQWILIDYGSVVVHIFDEETCEYYEIERLYRDAEKMDWRKVV